ncbi:MAG: FHA domain-containing protein [Lautropia sp.]|nr:FHA domain-containing protein [Lautropia sp.]
MSHDHQASGHIIYGQLTLSAASCPLQTYWLTSAKTTIGRRASNMLVLDDLTVSGEHAWLMVGQHEAIIQDLGSRNGTLLNGAPIARALLSDGDCIDIGVYRLVFQRVGPHGLPGQHVEGQDLGQVLQTAGFLPMAPMPTLPGQGDPRAHHGLNSAGFGVVGARPPKAGETDPFRPSVQPSHPSSSFAQPSAAAQADAAGKGQARQDGLPPVAGGGMHTPDQGGPMLPGAQELLGFIPGFVRAPRLMPSPQSPFDAAPVSRQRPPLKTTADFQGVSLRFLGGHDAGRLLLIDRPIVSIRNGSGQVAVVSARPAGFYLTHVEGQAYPLVNGESIGLAAHPLRHNDLIELSGTIIQFCQHPADAAGSAGPDAVKDSG